MVTAGVCVSRISMLKSGSEIFCLCVIALVACVCCFVHFT